MRRRLAAALALALAAQVLRARATRDRRASPGLVPAEVRRVTTDDGVGLHVELDGDPDADLAVVFVHGLLARSAEWDLQWEAFRSRHRVVRYDHAGHGRSDHRRGGAHVERLATDLGCVLDGLADLTGKQVVLVGHSMGGMTVLALAAQRPELFGSHVAGVALLGTGAGHDTSPHPVENAFRRLARLRLLAPLLLLLRASAPVAERLRPRGTWLMRRLTRELSFGGHDAPPALVRQVQAMLEEPPLRTLAALQGTVVRVDQRAALDTLRRVPVAVVAGSDDRLTRVEHARAIAADLGEAAELVVLPGVGHVLNRTRPTEVNSAIARLVERVRERADVVRRGASPV